MEFEVPEVAVPAPNGYQGDPLYERQSTLGLTAPSVTVIGCGGVGCWVALSLVLGGVNELHLYDGDTLSLHNLNRFPLPASANGEMKSVALAKWLSTLRPKADIRARGLFQAGVHDIDSTWVVCATDSLKSRVMIHKMARENGSYYLEVGADGERWGMSPAPPEFATELEDRTGYQTVPVHVGPCMMAGAAVAYHVLHNVGLRDSYSVDWDKGPITYNYGSSWGSLKFNKMTEMPLPVEMASLDYITCKVCNRQVQTNLILLVRHLREERGLSLLEAKTLAEKMIADYREAKAPAVEADLAGENQLEDYDPEFVPEFVEDNGGEAETEEARETENEQEV